MKRKFTVVLLVLFIIGLIPTAVSANSSQYTEDSSLSSLVDDAELHVYYTTGAGGDSVSLTDSNGNSTFAQGSGYRQYTATAPEGWVFKEWTYTQMFNGKDLGNRTDYGWGRRYSFSNSGKDWNTDYRNGDTISVNRLLTKGEVVGNPIIYSIYANFNPTITATASEGGSITPSGKTEVEYGSNQSYNITANENYIIDSIIIDGISSSYGKGESSYTYSFENVVEPHTIEVVFSAQPTYSVTYTDGVDNETIFIDQVTTDLHEGDKTPAFDMTGIETDTDGNPARENFVFAGWNPAVSDTVTGNATYIASWNPISPNPSAEPSTEPSAEPTTAPTTEPTTAPTAEPTTAPTTEPTTAPTAEPTTAPTTEPTTAPTTEPTTAPTTEPTTAPTAEPTTAPTAEPTTAPTAEPTTAPTAVPTATPTPAPVNPTEAPAVTPTPKPEQPENDVPQTGDETNVLLWIAVASVSGILLTGAAVASKSKKQKP